MEIFVTDYKKFHTLRLCIHLVPRLRLLFEYRDVGKVRGTEYRIRLNSAAKRGIRLRFGAVRRTSMTTRGNVRLAGMSTTLQLEEATSPDGVAKRVSRVRLGISFSGNTAAWRPHTPLVSGPTYVANKRSTRQSFHLRT